MTDDTAHPGRNTAAHLMDSASLYHDLVETSQDLIWQCDAEGRYTYLNPAWERVFGYTLGEMLGKKFSDFQTAEIAERDRKEFAFLMQGGSVRGYETTHVSKSGEPVHLVFNAKFLTAMDGTIAGTRGTAHDITERKRAEKQLLYVMKAVESTSEAIGISDAAGHHFYQNKALSTLFEYASAEELEAAGGGPAVVNDPAVAKEMFRSIMTGGSWAGELEMVTKSGRVFEAYERADAILDHEGRVIGLIGIISDISRRKRSEEVLRNLRKAVDTSREAVLMTDREGLITYVNPGFTALYGYTAEEVVGKVTPRILKSGLLDAAATCYLWETLLSGQDVRAEYTNRKKDGTLVPVEGSASPIFDDTKGIVGFLGIQRDISTRKRAEEARDKMEAQFLQAQKMEAVGRLAGGVAHDFNNMLVVILGHAEMAMDQVDPSQPIHADLEEIRKAATRSTDLTRQLLAFARKQTIAPRVLDLNETVAGMLAMLRRLIGEDIDLVWKPEDGLWSVSVDPSQIDQIMANLSVNARDAITGVGHVTIETGNSTIDEDYCANHAGFVPGEYVRVLVSDDGCGMTKETQSHLFEPFFTTKPMGKGTGLGLATVYGIVKQNNGFISVYSELGHGTTFAVYLPRHAAKTRQAHVDGATAGAALRGKETILLVEDESAILTLATKMLERQGYTVLAAGTPGAAIRLAREYSGQIHLLITDVVMPEMNGRDLARNILFLYPDLKRLFMSGYTADVIAHHGVLDQGVYFVQKPFSREALSAKVREALDG